MPFVDDFANSAKIAIERMGQPCTVAGKTVNAILENNYVPIEFLDGRTFESNEPMLTVSTQDVTHAANNDSVIFTGVTYTIAEIRPYDGGVTEMKLRETV